MERMPQVLESVSFPRRRPLEEMAKLGKSMSLAEENLGNQGRLLVRWSGTEAKLRVMLEGPDVTTLHELAQELLFAARQDLDVAP
jgi:phosphoglucosamine mutase